MRIKSLLIFILLSIFSKSIGIKIFVYDLPKRFNAEILEQNQQQLDTYPQRFSMGREEWNCLHNMFRTEITFHQKLMESEFRTTNPEEADFFYVPIYTVCRMNLNLPFDLKSSVTKSVSFHRDLLEYITQSYPYWNRSQVPIISLNLTHNIRDVITYSWLHKVSAPSFSVQTFTTLPQFSPLIPIQETKLSILTKTSLFLLIFLQCLHLLFPTNIDGMKHSLEVPLAFGRIQTILKVITEYGVFN